MAKYLLNSVGNFGFAGDYSISKEQLEGKESVYLDDLFKKLGDSDGSGEEIFLSKTTAPYEKTLRDRYPKAEISLLKKVD